MFWNSKQIKDLSDEGLIAQYKKSEDKTFVGELYKRYTFLVMGVSMKYLKNRDESEDMVMLVFEKLMKDLLRFEINNFKSWLHQVTKSQCLMLLRKKQSENKHHEYVAHFEESSVEIDSDAHLLDREVELEKLEEAIKKLKTEQKTCVELFYLQSKSYNEVAELTGFTLKEVKSFLQNGKRNLKIQLEQND